MLVCGDWLLTPQRAAVHLPTATAVIADLHLGYSETRRRAGEAVPLPNLDHVLTPLRRLPVDYGVSRLVIAGDLFESGAVAGLTAELLDWLREARLELTAVVPGNHDRGLRDDGALPLCLEGLALGRWRVLHGDGELPAGALVHGHFHPCLRWGSEVAAPCYLVGPERLVLPAFSTDAAGMSVRGDRRWQPYRCYVPAVGKVLDFGEVGRLRSGSCRPR